MDTYITQHIVLMFSANVNNISLTSISYVSESFWYSINSKLHELHFSYTIFLQKLHI